MGNRLTVMAWLGVLGIISGAGCKPISPTVPPDSSGPTPHGGYTTYSYQLYWDSTVATELQSLTINHPSDLSITEQDGLGDILVSVSIDVQNDSSQQLANAFQSEMTQNSAWTGTSPKVVVPTRTCKDLNQVVTGVCVRQFSLFLPKNLKLGLDLTWDGLLSISGSTVPEIALHLGPSSQATLAQTSGSISLDGGAPDSSFEIQQGTGAFTANLSQIQSLKVEQDKGSISIELAQPKGASVDVNGTPITQFPFHSP